MNHSLPLNTIILGDTIETLKQLPDNSIDLIFADPPYNMQVEGKLLRANGNAFDGVEGHDWDEFTSLEDYKRFTRAWLQEAKRVLKKDKSSIWVCGSFQNIYTVGSIMQDLGFWIINDIVWSKTNPTPNFKGTKFTNKQETLLWATPSPKTKYQFNYKTMKALNNGKQMTSVWDISVAAGGERLKDRDGNKLHPTQKPEELLIRALLSSTNVGDVVLDPFMGSGTTGAIAKRLGRNFIGIERDPKYREYALERIEKETVVENEYTHALFDIKPPKVTFRELVNAGYLSAHEELFFKGTDITARLGKEKDLAYQGEEYNISRLGGKLSKVDGNANGWEVWLVVRDGKKIPLADIRRRYREEKLGFVEFDKSAQNS